MTRKMRSWRLALLVCLSMALGGVAQLGSQSRAHADICTACEGCAGGCAEVAPGHHGGQR